MTDNLSDNTYIEIAVRNNSTQDNNPSEGNSNTLYYSIFLCAGIAVIVLLLAYIFRSCITERINRCLSSASCYIGASRRKGDCGTTLYVLPDSAL